MMIVRYYLFVSCILISTIYSAQTPSEHAFKGIEQKDIVISKNILLLNIEKMCMKEGMLISRMYEDINKEFGVVPDLHEDEWYDAMVQEIYNSFDTYISPEDEDRIASEEKSIDRVKRMINGTLGLEKACNNSIAIQAEIEKIDRRIFRGSLILWVLQGGVCAYGVYMMYKKYQEKKRMNKVRVVRSNK